VVVAEARSLVDELLEPARAMIADPQVLTRALAYAALIAHEGGDDKRETAHQQALRMRAPQI